MFGATSGASSLPFAIVPDKKNTHHRTMQDNIVDLSHIDRRVQTSPTVFALGQFTTCAFDPNYLQQCWGRGDSGEFGNGQQTISWTPLDIFLQDGNGTAITPIYMAGGSRNSFVIDDEGHAWAYGKDNFGNLGLGQSYIGAIVNIPQRMIGLSNTPSVVKIANLNLHTCILDEEGDVHCVGHNTYGELGLGYVSSGPVYTPGLVSFSNAVVDVDVGYYFTCVVDDQKQLWCFGRNLLGQLGVGNNVDQSSPTLVSSLGTAVDEFSLGSYHACALKDDKTFWCWGWNINGQLGNGGTSDKNVPTEVTLLTADVVKFALGLQHSCVLDVDNDVYCWGHNAQGQLGVGDTNNRLTPTQVTLPSTPADILAEHIHTCAPTTSSGELYCWGDNIYGQLGINNTANQNTPTLTLWEPTASNPTTLAPTITNADSGEFHIQTTGNATETILSGSTIQISLPFNTSNREHGALVWDSDCVTPIDNTACPDCFSPNTTAPSTTDGFIQFNSTLTINIDEVNNTFYWNPFTDGTKGGWVEVCLETYLSFTDDLDRGNDDVEQKVDFVNHRLNISVSLTSDFEVDGVDIEREEVTQEDINFDYSEFVEAYECDESALDTAIPAGTKTYNQGDEITICVTDTSNDIVQVEEFIQLKASQSGLSDYNYIFNSLWNDEITTPVCLDNANNGRRVCYVKILALARFFSTATPTDLTISGRVFLIRDGRRVRRELRMALPAPPEKNDGEEDTLAASTARRAQADGEEEGIGDFEVTASLGSSVDSAAPNHIAGAASTGLVAVAVGAALMIY